MIEFNCPHCNNSMRVPDEAAGKRGNCKKCGNTVDVPNTQIIADSGQPMLVNPARPELVQPPAEQPPQVVVVNTPQPQPIIDTRPPVSVNIQREKRHSNSLGIGSIILGLVAFMFCWIPVINFISFVFGGIGLLLAIIGFFVGMGRKGSGVGFPITGGVFCGFALFVTASMYFTFFAVATGVSNAVADAEKQPNVRNNVKPKPQITRKPLPPDSTSVEKKKMFLERGGNIHLQKNNPTKEEKATPKLAPVKPLPLGKVATAGDVTVEVLDATITPDNKNLKVRILIKNNNGVIKHTYSQWHSKYFRNGDMLVDDKGRSYETVSGSFKTQKLLPNEEIEDVLVFEAPEKDAKSFTMTLYPRSFTKRKPLEFKFGL